LKKIIPIILIGIIACTSCKSKFQKLLTGSDYNLKYEKAIEYYNQEDYMKSQQLFESIITIYRGTDKSENIVYYLSMCYFNQKDYLFAGYYFKTFTTSFPTSEKLEECMFNTGYCYYEESAKYSLDQEYTYKSLEEFEIFSERFSESEKIPEVKKYVNELQKKLEKKAYENAILYEKIGNHKSAIIALKNCLYDYPNIKERENILYFILKSSYQLANNSVKIKKYDRYEATIDEYFSYIDEFPSGKYIKEAEKMYVESKKYIDKF
jgi:outer membrane protein assembly factor BamD